jgi:hypothetical protein
MGFEDFEGNLKNVKQALLVGNSLDELIGKMFNM